MAPGIKISSNVGIGKIIGVAPSANARIALRASS